MTQSRVHEGSLRPGSREAKRLAWALAISLAIHFLGFGGYEIGRRLNLHLPGWLEKLRQLAAVPVQPKPPADQETPLIFVDVNPRLAATEEPKDAKYYSSKNSQASSSETQQESNVPKIIGNQTDVVKAEDVDRAKLDRLQPVFPKAEKEQEQAKPKTTEPPGDLAMMKPDVMLRPDAGTEEKPRPRTLKEAYERQNRNQLAGQKMKQDGGAGRHLEFTSLDAKATAFGAYDAAFIEAVESRWFDLLDSMSVQGYRRGRVVLQFHLDYNGRISDMKIVDNSVGETLSLLCQKAVLDPAPFDKWPREMRLLVDKDYREIQFAFYYN